MTDHRYPNEPQPQGRTKALRKLNRQRMRKNYETHGKYTDPPPPADKVYAELIIGKPGDAWGSPIPEEKAAVSSSKSPPSTTPNASPRISPNTTPEISSSSSFENRGKVTGPSGIALPDLSKNGSWDNYKEPSTTTRVTADGRYDGITAPEPEKTKEEEAAAAITERVKKNLENWPENFDKNVTVVSFPVSSNRSQMPNMFSQGPSVLSGNPFKNREHPQNQAAIFRAFADNAQVELKIMGLVLATHNRTFRFSQLCQKSLRLVERDTASHITGPCGTLLILWSAFMGPHEWYIPEL